MTAQVIYLETRNIYRQLDIRPGCVVLDLLPNQEAVVMGVDGEFEKHLVGPRIRIPIMYRGNGFPSEIPTEYAHLFPFTFLYPYQDLAGYALLSKEQGKDSVRQIKAEWKYGN